MEENTKMIECPEHQGKHIAILYLRGSQYAGVWECPTTGQTGSCQHESYHAEEAAENHISFGGHYQTEKKVSVCDACDQTINLAFA